MPEGCAAAAQANQSARNPAGIRALQKNMSIEFKFPDVGEGIQEAEIVKWRVKEGDSVEEHQTLVEVETDKAVVEIPSPVTGKIESLRFREGQTIRVGDVLVTFVGEGNVPSHRETHGARPEPAAPPAAPAKRESVSVVGALSETEDEVMPAPAAPKLAAASRQVLTTPAVRRLAKDLGVDLNDVPGSGPQGRILEADVRRFAERKGAPLTAKDSAAQPPSAVQPAVPLGSSQRIPIRGVRKAVCKHLTHAYATAVHVTHHDEADATALMRFREKSKADAERAGVRVTFLPLIIKAVIASLKKHPYLNSSLDDAKEEIILKGFYNIGIALDTPDGLMVPVIKGADTMTVFQLAREIERLAAAGRDRKIKLEELKDGTFTISNVGFVGGVFATPIVNHPECAILATGRIVERAVVRDGAVAIRKTLPLSLSFDHRIVDGAEAARFVNDIIAYIEDPALLLLNEA
jgi:pyruvate dehydrogenase E2 component (dihydrolipoamide acetyltransferase)